MLPYFFPSFGAIMNAISLETRNKQVLNFQHTGGMLCCTTGGSQ